MKEGGAFTRILRNHRFRAERAAGIAYCAVAFAGSMLVLVRAVFFTSVIRLRGYGLQWGGLHPLRMIRKSCFPIRVHCREADFICRRVKKIRKKTCNNKIT